MKANMGKMDKGIRIVIALVLVGLYLGKVVTGTVAVIALVAAIVFLLTSLLNFCPLYVPFKWNTKKEK